MSTIALRSSHARKNRTEMYARDLIVGDEPSDLSSRADALSAYQVDLLSSHRATKPKKKKKKTTTKNLNKTSNLSECEDSLASTADEEQQQLQGDVEDLSAGKIGARRRLRSRQFNITLKQATQTDRNRIKLLSVSEEGKLLRKYEVSSAHDWLGYGPYTVSIGTTPSCSCKDFMKSRTVKICKHLIWVCVIVLGVDDKNDTLQQAALTEQEVRSIFQRAPPPCTQPKPALGRKRVVTMSSTNDAQSNADRVIRNDLRSNHPQVWRLERLNRSAGPKPQCAGCKKVSFDSGDILSAVDALYVPRDKEFCVQRTYRFCADVPRFSNLRPARNALPGQGATQEDIEKAFCMWLTIE